MASSYKALTSPHVFACHCSIETDRTQVGILILSEDFQPGVHSLYALDDPSQSIACNIPYQPGCYFKATLTHDQSSGEHQSSSSIG